MTDHDHDEQRTAEVEQLQRLFDRAQDTGPANAALDRLVYCHLLNRVTAGDVNAALEVFGNPGAVDATITELEQLSTEEREGLAASVGPMWSHALSRAVILMWRACRRLGYDPEGLGGDHLALLASVLLCTEGEMVDNTLE